MRKLAAVVVTGFALAAPAAHGVAHADPVPGELTASSCASATVNGSTSGVCAATGDDAQDRFDAGARVIVAGRTVGVQWSRVAAALAPHLEDAARLAERAIPGDDAAPFFTSCVNDLEIPSLGTFSGCTQLHDNGDHEDPHLTSSLCRPDGFCLYTVHTMTVNTTFHIVAGAVVGACEVFQTPACVDLESMRDDQRGATRRAVATAGDGLAYLGLR